MPFGDVATPPPVGDVADDDGGEVGELVPLGDVSALFEEVVPPVPPPSLLLTFPIAEDDDEDDDEEEVKTLVTLSITLPLMMVPILEAALGAGAVDVDAEEGREDAPPALEA